ncbi:hypothetical protein ACPCIZ_22780 [Streptomyces cellulosae]
MARDLLDPGPDYNGQPAFLNWPRNAQGEPCFSDTHTSADVVFPQPGSPPGPRGVSAVPNPAWRSSPFGERFLYTDMTLRGSEGNPYVPPTIPLDECRRLYAEYYG